MNDLISRQAAIDKFIDELEAIFSDIREREVDDSVCGLCEYDGAYIGQSGDWCNECPGFDRDDCFKLSDKIRKEWTDEIIKALPSAQSETNCSEIPNNWVPCSERLPDKGDDYLVTLWDDGRTWVEIALWNETFGGRWQAVLYNDVDYSDISNVIAWMPIPEPYRACDEQESH